MASFFSNFVRQLKETGEYRSLVTVGTPQGPEIDFGGRRILNFCSNDYLDLAKDVRLQEAAIETIRKFGMGGASTRFVSANFPIYEELENALSRFKGADAALLFNSGYHANTGVIPTLVGPGDAVFFDEHSHPSLTDGILLSQAENTLYRHKDMNHLEWALKHHRSPSARRLIVTETVFNVSGDLCPLSDLLPLAEKYGAMVYLDEAHAFGVMGDHGEGLAPRNPPDYVISMATLSKALGTYGAFVACNKGLREYFINAARTFIFTAAPSPATIGAALASLKLSQLEPERRQRLWDNIEYFGEKLFRMDSLSPIFTVTMGIESKVKETWWRLMESGIYLQEILPPLVHPDYCRLRLAVTAAHRKEHLDRLLENLVEKTFS